MNSRPYTVHIYEGEASLISNWTLQYPSIETGGDLFGLWLNENEVVIQAVLGPGQNCRRTTTSFFQDEQYLSNVGGLLTHSQGLCNVGSWHSHHTMNIPDPSRGDRDTVWRHLPTPGRFLLLIATIETTTGAPIVQMGFNLFESTTKGNKVIPMKLEILQGQSPIRANKTVSNQMFKGAEVPSKKTSYPEHSGNKPKVAGAEVNVQTNGKPDVTEDFFKRQKSDRRGHRRSHDHNITCDKGVTRSSLLLYNTSPRSEVRHPRPRYNAENKSRKFMFRSYKLPDGREAMILCHYDHELGSCKDCRYAKVTRGSDGKMYVESMVEYHQEDCCTIL